MAGGGGMGSNYTQLYGLKLYTAQKCVSDYIICIKNNFR